ncbi:MAG: hypothetical protein ABWZ66_00705 [Pyrinomonadaceae bacterium]
MATISPLTSTLEINETQQFTQSGLGSPVWTLEGNGTLSQSGLYTAPGTGAINAVVRVHSSAWFSHLSAYYTKNADDTLTKNTNSAAYFDTAVSNAGLTSVGDAVEHVCHKTNAWGIYVHNANYAQIFGVYGGSLQEVHPGGNHTGSMTPLQIGDICRIEMVTGGKLRFSINGVTQYTSVNTYTTSVGDFVFTIDADVPLGTVIKVPKWYGSGITNYNEARATIAVLPQMLTGNKGAELYCEANLLSLADSAYVASFTDWSGKGRHLTASTNYPTFETNEINSKPVIRFHGTSNPLKNTAQFEIRCGWILAKYSGGSTFTDYKGLLSDLNVTTILLGEYDTANFLDNQSTQIFEFRSNDRIYPESAAPAPMQVFKLIFFRFWRNLSLDGIQLGQQTNFTSTKWHGDVPFLALYSRDFCESDIRKYSKAVADAYDLVLADVYPYQADKGSPKTSIQSVNFYDPPEGTRISEALDDPKRELDLKFSSRRQAEVKKMRDFHDSHYGAAVECIYRDYDVIPPEDVLGYIDSPYQAAGAVNDWSYAFKFKEK